MMPEPAKFLCCARRECKAKAKRVGAVQPGKQKALGRPYSGFSVPEGAYKKAGEGLFTRACSNRTRGNDFKLKEVGKSQAKHYPS